MHDHTIPSSDAGDASGAARSWPTVSVVIPSYNCSRYLPRALDSVLDQRYPRHCIDIVVVDDGSVDDSAAIAHAYAARDRRIRVIEQANAGPAAARNRGIEASAGELVAFLDADDTWEPEKLAMQAEVYRCNPLVGLIQCGARFVDADGTPLRDWVRKSRVLRGDILLEYVCDFFLITSAVVVPRSCLDAVGWFDESLRIGEDHDLFLRLLSRFHADGVDAALLNRTVRPDSLSRLDFDADARQDLLLLDDFVQANPDFYRRHARRIDARFAQYLYLYGYRLLEEGRRNHAQGVLMRSLRKRPSVAAAKALVRSALPPAVVSVLRN